MYNCPNKHGALVQVDDTHWLCQTCGYSFVIAKGRVDKTTEAVNQAIREMLVEARVTGEQLPWKRPWIVIPKRNYDSGTVYRGVNRWLLSFDPEISYLTKESVEKKGLALKEGAKARFVIAFKPPMLTKKEKATLLPDQQREVLAKKRPWMFSHLVYMARDVEGLEPKTYPEDQKNKRYHSIEYFLYEVQTKFGIDIREGGNSAAYSFADDVVMVPRIEQCSSSDDYYRSVFHEIAHATGHESRLNRDPKKYNRGADYGKEELIAEFAGAYLAHYFGIPVEQNTAAYIDNWLKAIDGDARLLVSAAQRAEDVLKFFELT